MLRFETLVSATFAVAALAGSTTADAQNGGVALRLGRPVERAISAGETHSYSVNLAAGQFMFTAIVQDGIDLAVAVVNPAGDTISRGNSPNGSQGIEPVSLFSDTSGRYQMVVRPLNVAPPPGHYTIALERIEPAAALPGDRVDQLFAAWDRPGSPGAAVAVVQNGAVVHANGYGLANLEYGIPNTPATIFHAASVSKQFTAFAVTMLAVEGRLSLDDEVRIHIPELRDFGHSITIRHLLHHTSGLRDQWGLLSLAGWRMDDVITHDQIMRLVGRQRELNFEPGEEYLYSNTGFTLLAAIVTRITGQPFPEWTAEHIFEPLGMENTHFHFDHEDVVPNRAYSYKFSDGDYHNSVLSYANVGATSLFTTVEDLALWADNFETGHVGGPNVIRLMRTRGVLNNGDTLDYAFGQAIGAYKGLRALSHSGADAGYRSYLIRFPHQRTSVAVLSNLASFDASRMARQVADLYLAGRFSELESGDLSTAGNRTQGLEMLLDATVLERYVGDYELQPGVLVKISRNGTQLIADATGRQRVRLIPASETRFFVEGTDVYIDFQRGAGGRASSLTLVQTGQEIEASRIEPFDPGSVVLEDYAGSFYSGELATTYTLTVERDTLRATHIRHDPIPLTPTGPDAFASEVWYLAQLIFMRNRQDRIVGFRASSGRVRGLAFVKIDR